MTMLKLAQDTTLPLTRLRLRRSNSVRVNPAHRRDIDWILASHGRFRWGLVCFMLAASELRRECVRVLWDGNAVVHFLSTLLVCWEIVQGLGVGKSILELHGVRSSGPGLHALLEWVEGGAVPS